MWREERRRARDKVSVFHKLMSFLGQNNIQTVGFSFVGLLKEDYYIQRHQN
jgi:hypothetical protein